MHFAAGLEKVSLVGWSDGGITALVMAVFHPDIIDKLVLFGCNAYITSQDVKLLEGKLVDNIISNFEQEIPCFELNFYICNLIES